jgi:hypothetical protein
MDMKTVLMKWNKRYNERITSDEEKPAHTIKSLRELLFVLEQI